MKIRRTKIKPISVMLTPMIDMFTMILIFLITSYAPDEARIKKSPTILLPASELKFDTIPHVQIEISKDYVKLNGQNIEGLIPETGDSKSWEGLKAGLDNAQKTFPKKEPILLLADKGLSYRYVDRAVAYMAAAGYATVYLVAETRKDPAK